MADFKLIQQSVHKTSKDKGWYDTKRSDVESIMLVVTELSEAVESIRNNEPAIWQNGPVLGEKHPTLGLQNLVRILPNAPEWKTEVKPEGVLTELADAVIRIMDLCEANGWDLENAIRLKHAYNMTRPYRHGGKTL